jgi:hypothetical protein
MHDEFTYGNCRSSASRTQLVKALTAGTKTEIRSYIGRAEWGTEHSIAVGNIAESDRCAEMGKITFHCTLIS